MKKLLFAFLLLITLLGVNQVAFLAKVQFICNDKINRGEDLNIYETFSALQTHTSFWMFGWVVSPSTAQMCFCKQFFIRDPLWFFPIKGEDQQIKEAKRKLDNGAKEVKLAWKSYDSEASLFLNGSTITKEELDDGVFEYYFDIPGSYEPGIIKIGPITICETVFDYLENKHFIDDFGYQRDNLHMFY